MIYNGDGRPEMLIYSVGGLITSLTYTFKLYSMNKIFTSEAYASLVIQIGVVPSKPGQPDYLYDEFVSGSITIGWLPPSEEGGWPINSYLIWVDDGNDNWPTDPIEASVETFADLDYLTYLVTGLTDSLVYGFKIQATNDIGTSIESNSQYFACAEVPGPATEAPVLEAATDSSMTISWSVPAYNGGSAITGYKVYINPLDDGDWSLIYDGAGQPTVHSYKVMGLKRGLHYRFKSAALNYVGEGANSTESTLLCAATPNAPGQPQYISSTESELTMSWSAA